MTLYQVQKTTTRGNGRTHVAVLLESCSLVECPRQL